jgi:hypothetical protein
MSPETNNPVRDGIQNAADPIPREVDPILREPVGTPATDDSSKGLQAAGRSEPGGDDPGVHDPSGRAEEEDEAAPDQRGLTTELGPTD